ncbi:MAG: CoA transferase [Armatimonadota bacterium]|nr:CoA transferase [Armatimonadota bacterium]MDR7492267.1 CoA transferase [Armatimonadota bacterium]MDR7593207.1 CoA transferase [Armatimonadota bacterium]
MAPPLSGLRVVDFSRIVAGPLATQILSDYGAEVVKVEQPGTGDDARHWAPPRAPDGQATYFLAVNRGKRSVTLDLKHPEGRALAVELARRADVVVENFTPGTMDRLGLGYADLRAVNPRLVYCSVSGFGQTGPARDRAGYDAILQGVTGLMSITGEPDGPPVKVGVAVIDVVTALYAHGAILAALHHRERTGQGQHVELSLFECGIAALINAATAYLVGGEVQGRWGSAHPSIVPYQAFRARDGYLMVGAGNERLWRAFCRVLGAPEWADDPRFASNARRVEHRAELVRLVEERLQGRSRDEWVAAFTAAGLPAGPINDVAQVFADPQVAAREMVVEVDHPTAGRLHLPGIPVKFLATPARVQGPPPLLGEHTGEVLRDWLGLGPDEVAALAARGAFGTASAGPGASRPAGTEGVRARGG